MSARAPTYSLISEVQCPSPSGNGANVLESGTFIRPIDISYVPKHITSKNEYRFFDGRTEIYCYTRYGIIPIKRSNIRETP